MCMGTLLDLKNNTHASLINGMQTLGDSIARDMRTNLAIAGHIDTGALYNSIRAETKDLAGKIVTYIYADAKSQNGTQYAEFIELGSGAAHGRAGGRVGSWRYKDRNGKWHTTDGMDADPFIQPALDDNLVDWVGKVFTDFEKYAKQKAGV